MDFDFDGTNQLLFLYSAFFKCLRKTGIKWSNSSYIRYLDFKKAYDSVRREVFCNMITEFCICMKLILIIKTTKMCLNETCSTVQRTLMIDNLLKEEKNIYI